MRKEFIIASNNDISHMFDVGKRYQARSLIAIISEHEKRHGDRGRVAFIAGKKLGNAVQRNRMKRIMRAAADECGLPLIDRDILIIANRNTIHSDSRQCAESLSKIITSLKPLL